MRNIEELAKNLEDVGLGEKEKLVYIKLFEMGGRGFPSAIAKRAGINRSTTYKTLTSLSIKGLVNNVEKGSKAYYQLNKPEKLVSYVEYQSKELHKKLDNIKRITPDLGAMFSNLSKMPKVFFYEGYREVKTIYEDMTSYKNYEMLAFFNVKYVEGFMSNEDLDDFVKTRERQKIAMRAILPDTGQDRSYAERVYGKIDKKYFPRIRHIPKDMYPYDGEVTVYGKNKVAIFNLNKDTIDKQIIGVVIEDDMVHGMMKMIFELAWRGTKDFEK